MILSMVRGWRSVVGWGGMVGWLRGSVVGRLGSVIGGLRGMVGGFWGVVGLFLRVVCCALVCDLSLVAINMIRCVVDMLGPSIR